LSTKFEKVKAIVSQKIKNARSLNGFSQKELADLIGVSKQMISKYEKGESIPSSSNFLKLAKSLKVKMDYFFAPSTIELGVINFRKKSSFSNKKQETLEQLIRLNLENYLEVENLLQIDYSFNNIIKYDIIETYEDIEKVVLKLRNEWEIGLDPIHNIIQLLEDKEIKVIEVFDVEDSFDGLATFVNEKYPIIVINGNFPVERKRFTLLHELGHLLLNLPEGLLLKEEENYCNRFASEFLFPKKLAIKEFGIKRNSISLNELIQTQIKYGISIQAIIYRLVDIEILSENKKTDFYKKLNFNSNLKREVNQPRFITPEKSNRFEQLVYRALTQEIISLSKASSLLNKNMNILIENSLF
jgi:Zn-dependent peptidase ImmA (M78 family)